MLPGSGIIRRDLRFVGQVIHEASDGRQPKEHTGQGTQGEEPQRIAATHVLRLVGKNGHQFVLREPLRQVLGDIHLRPPIAGRECRVWKTVYHPYASGAEARPGRGQMDSAASGRRLQWQRAHDMRVTPRGTQAVEGGESETGVQEGVEDRMHGLQ
jgi:hypothetical protein